MTPTKKQTVAILNSLILHGISLQFTIIDVGSCSQINRTEWVNVVLTSSNLHFPYLTNVASVAHFIFILKASKELNQLYTFRKWPVIGVLGFITTRKELFILYKQTSSGNNTSWKYWQEWKPIIICWAYLAKQHIQV